ncbi:hypothetical protein K474DRAFT_638745 [Panus rudis PR-1116 ss-1]|nr:hypothetical protein K474DRAFT_638745 [Panus rudis PR-1116 ss-1]
MCVSPDLHALHSAVHQIRHHLQRSTERMACTIVPVRCTTSRQIQVQISYIFILNSSDEEMCELRSHVMSLQKKNGSKMIVPCELRRSTSNAIRICPLKMQSLIMTWYVTMLP